MFKDTPHRRQLTSIALIMATSLTAGCGVAESTHRAALKDAEDARIELTKSQSSAILKAQELEKSKQDLQSLKQSMEVLRRENQRLKQSDNDDANLIEALEHIVGQQDEQRSALNDVLSAEIKAKQLNIVIQDGYITLKLPSARLFDPAQNLTKDAKQLSANIFEALHKLNAKGLLRCHDAKTTSTDSKADQAPCTKQLNAFYATNLARKERAASIALLTLPQPTRMEALLEIVLLPDLIALDDDHTSIEGRAKTPPQQHILGTIEAGVEGGVLMGEGFVGEPSKEAKDEVKSKREDVKKPTPKQPKKK